MSIISMDDIENIKVSSSIRGKSFRKQNMFDGSDETCWKSDEGTPQWVVIALKQKCTVSSFSIQFQGGFAGKTCSAVFKSGSEEVIMPFFPEDDNSLQNYTLKKPVNCNEIMFTFQESTDFFGRIVIYLITFH